MKTYGEAQIIVEGRMFGDQPERIAERAVADGLSLVAGETDRHSPSPEEISKIAQVDGYFVLAKDDAGSPPRFEKLQEFLELEAIGYLHFSETTARVPTRAEVCDADRALHETREAAHPDGLSEDEALFTEAEVEEFADRHAADMFGPDAPSVSFGGDVRPGPC